MIKNNFFSILFGCLIFACPVLSGAQGVDIGLSKEEKVRKAQEYYSAGSKLAKQGNYTQANEEFKKAQQLLAREGSESAALTGTPVNNTKAQAIPLKKETEPLITKGTPEEMAIHYLRAIEVSPKDQNLYYNLGVEYLKSNHFSQAAQAFNQVIQINPKDKDAYYNLGVLFESYFNDKNQALIYYNQYLKLANKPEDASRVRNWIKQIKKGSDDK